MQFLCFNVELTPTMVTANVSFKINKVAIKVSWQVHTYVCDNNVYKL